MYTIAGVIMNAGTHCLNEHCTGLTEEELRYLRNGPDDCGYNRVNTMERWPRRYYNDYERDEDSNEIIFDEDVVLTKDNIPKDREDNPITVFFDDGSWEDGCWCDTCSQVLIKPYTIDCFRCEQPALEGNFALTIENEKVYDIGRLPCADCIDRHFRVLLDTIIGELRRESAYEHVLETQQVETMFGVVATASASNRTRQQYYQEYIEKAEKEESLYTFADNVETQTLAYIKDAATLERADALQTIHEITQGVLITWEEELDVEAKGWHELRERYTRERGY